MNYLIIDRDKRGNTKMKAEINGKTYQCRRYMFYSMKDAEKSYREEFNLKGKHFTRINTGISYC